LSHSGRRTPKRYRNPNQFICNDQSQSQGRRRSSSKRERHESTKRTRSTSCDNKSSEQCREKVKPKRSRDNATSRRGKVCSSDDELKIDPYAESTLPCNGPEQKMDKIFSNQPYAAGYDRFEAPRFIAAACFAGPRPGYVFTRHGVELGYYLEEHPRSDRLMEFACLPFWSSSVNAYLRISATGAPHTYDGPTGGLVGSTVRVTRMLRPGLNGREGLAEAFDSTINRYTVRFNQGESLQLLASQLIHVNDSSPDLDAHEKSQSIIDDCAYLDLCRRHFHSTYNTLGPPSSQSHVSAPPFDSYASYVKPSATGTPLSRPTHICSPAQLNYVGEHVPPQPESPEDLINAFIAKQREIVNAPEMCGDYTLEEYMGDEGNGERLTGTLLWFDQTKQYGFIAPENGSDNYFTHGIDIYDQVYKGQKVHFEHATDISGRKKACMVTPWGGGTRSGPCNPIYYYQSSVAHLNSIPSKSKDMPRTIGEYYAMQKTNAPQQANNGRPPWLVDTAIALPLAASAINKTDQ